MPDVLNAIREEAKTASPRQRKMLAISAIILGVLTIGPALYLFIAFMAALSAAS